MATGVKVALFAKKLKPLERFDKKYNCNREGFNNGGIRWYFN